MNAHFILATVTQAKDGLVSTFNAVPDDKLNWKPFDNGRAALDFFGEVAQTFKLIANILETRGADGSAAEIFASMRQERANWSKADALAAMETHFAHFERVVGGFSDEQLCEILALPLGSGMTLPLAGWAMMTYRSCISRFAQINYIQTLYGDFDMH